MRVGLVVDGEAEYHSFKLVMDKLNGCGLSWYKILKADLQPHSPPERVARAAESSFKILARKNASLIVVVMDTEIRQECYPDLLHKYYPPLKKRLGNIDPSILLELVLKVTSYENWLIADPDAFSHLYARFPNHQVVRKAAIPNRADHQKAMDVIRKALPPKVSYDKVQDAKRICKYLVPERAAKNSRSFRRLLRVLHHPEYLHQSKLPA